MAATFANEFVLFNATDLQGLIAALNEWGSNQEHLVSENRGAVMVQGAELEQLRDAFIVLENAQTRVQQLGSQAVAELDVLMGAFRQEIVLSRSEQTAAGEAFKEELRVLTGQLRSSKSRPGISSSATRTPRPSRPSFARSWPNSRHGS